MKMKLLVAAVTSAMALTLAGCSDSKSDSPLTKVLKTNADIAHAAYSDSVTTAEELKTALTALKNDPKAETLTAAKNAWLTSREPYGQTEVYRFRESPIDSVPGTNANDDGPEGDLNAWPLGEALIDYVKSGNDFGDDEIGVPAHGISQVNSGETISAAHANANQTDNIIGNTNIAINADLLTKNLTDEDKERDVIAGYHAIEFILWGQDLNDDGTANTEDIRDASGGQRPVTDFANDNTCTSGDANVVAQTICDRRHQFMAVVVDKLITDLKSVRDQWADDGAYRKTFVDSGNKGLLEILTGMGTLAEGELAGERMKIALNNDSQEDEHSCFSDNTHRDIWLNAEGVSNSYYGEYAGYDSNQDGTDDKGTKVSGYGLDDYLKSKDLTDVATAVENALKATETAYKAIDNDARNNKPFDVVINDNTSNDAAHVKATIEALNKEAQEIQKMAKALGLDGVVVDPTASGCDTSTGDSSNSDEEC